MNLVFAFRYRRAPYIIQMIVSIILFFSGLAFLGLALLLLFAFRAAMGAEAVSGLTIMLFALYIPSLMAEIVLMLYAGSRLSPNSYVIAGTAESLTVQSPFLKKRTYAWSQIEYVDYLPARTTVPGSRSFWTPWGYHYRRSYLYIKPYRDKAARIDVTFLDGQIEDVFSCFSRIKPDLVIMKKGENPL